MVKISLNHNKKAIEIAVIGIVSLGLLFVFYKTFTLYKSLKETKSELASTKSDIAKLTNEKQELEDNLLEIESKNTDLEKQLGKETSQNKSLNKRVTTLTKLTTIDPELLKKYSKVYFLNENYEPTSLSDIPKEYLNNSARNIQFHGDAIDFLENLLENAKEDNIPLQIASAYRSFGTQTSLKSNYTFLYGAGTANQFSADQGYSEHQLGTAVDFTTPTINGAYPAFEQAPAYTWLLNNAYKYGFILSYPKNNTYYEFEPWHWRFVGSDLSQYLHENKLNFYDMNQRDIDTYLLYIFD